MLPKQGITVWEGRNVTADANCRLDGAGLCPQLRTLPCDWGGGACLARADAIIVSDQGVMVIEMDGATHVNICRTRDN